MHQKNTQGSFPKSINLLIPLAFMFLLLAGTAHAQLPCGYKYSRLIRIDHTKVMGGADLQNYPVYLTTVGLGDEALLKSVGNGGHVQSSNGYDIAFTAADGVTPLSFQMENYVAGTGEYEAWINIPYVSHTADTYFYMYYDNAAIVTDQSSTGAWDANTVGVWHMDNSTTPDVTVNAQTTSDAGTTNNAAGEILAARTFSGGATPTSKQWVQVGINGASSNEGTVDLWGKITTYETSTYFFGESSTQNASYNNRIQLFQNDAAGTLELGIGSSHTLTSVMTLSKNTWYHIVATWSTTGGGKGNYAVYIDGALKKSGTYAGFSSVYSTADVGNDGNAGQETEALTGSVDEVHISNVTRTAGWIGTEYNNESSPSTFCLISAEPELWLGTTNSNWNTASNWSGGVVPAGGANAIITNSASFQPTLNVNEQVGYLWVQTGATLTIPAGQTLSVTYSTINCGTISSATTGTVNYNTANTQQNQYISGTGTYSLGLLTANPAALADTVFLNTSTVAASSNFLISQGVYDCQTYGFSVAGNFTDNSIFQPATGSVTLNGSTGTQAISSTEAGGLTFYDLTFQNTSATAPGMNTTANITVNDQLTFNAANTAVLNLNANTITLGTSVANPGTLSYPAATAGWVYGGTFKRWFQVNKVTIPNNAGLFPVGSDGVQNDYHPLWLGSTANLSSGGTVSVYHSPTTAWYTPVSFTDASWTPPVTGTPIQGVSVSVWQVTTGNGLALSASNGQIRFGGYGYNIFILADLDACQAAGALATYSASTNAVVPLEVNRIGLSLADINNSWHIGTDDIAGSPLPIELTSFTADCENGYPVLKWTTATETSNDYFTIDKTTDGVNYQTVTTIKGAGNSSSPKNYSVIDYGNVTGITYYRLSQTDLDGSTAPLKSIVYVPCENIESINAFSANSTNAIHIQINSNSEAEYTITLTNALGQKILGQTKNVVPGLTIFTLYPQVNAGVYILQITGNNKVYTRKIVLSSNW